MQIVKQGLIKSPHDISRLNIIDFKRTNGYWENDFLKGFNTVASWLVGRASFTIVKDDLSAYPTRSDWPGWKHAGDHEQLGRLYWNCFMTQFEDSSPTLQFHDEPDFQGSFIDEEGLSHTIWGDIGRVSVSTFVIEVLPALTRSDLWVSIPDAQTQIIIEPLTEIPQLIQRHLDI